MSSYSLSSGLSSQIEESLPFFFPAGSLSSNFRSILDSEEGFSNSSPSDRVLKKSKATQTEDEFLREIQRLQVDNSYLRHELKLTLSTEETKKLLQIVQSTIGETVDEWQNSEHNFAFLESKLEILRSRTHRMRSKNNQLIAENDALRALSNEKEEALKSKDAVITNLVSQLKTNPSDTPEQLTLENIENLPWNKYEQVIQDLKEVAVKAKNALKSHNKRTFTPQLTHKFQGCLSTANSSLQKKRTQKNTKKAV